MNPIERAILFLFPSWAAKRAASRYACRQFSAADLDRLRSKKVYGTIGPRTENRQSREKLLSTARDLDRNNSFAHGAFNALVNNIVGRGFHLEARTQSRDGRLFEPTNRAIEDEWEAWAVMADSRGRLGYGEIQRLVERELWVAGEVLVIRTFTRDDGRRVPLGVEVVESERLAAFDGPGTTGNQIVQGVEVNPRGEVVAYHIYEDFPGDSARTPEIQRIEASRVLHLFHSLRPNQIRGHSRIASVARNLEAVGQFMDHELTKARIAASFALMITRGGLSMAPKFPVTDDASDQFDSNGNPIGHIEGGMIFTGGPNDDLKGTGPSVQSTAFEQFITVNLRAIAVGLDMSYELLARDFTKATFSSARQATHEDIRGWNPRQEFLKKKLNDRVFQWFIDSAVLMGIEPFASNERRLDWDWILPGREYINPKEEIEADILQIQTGITTLQKVAAKHGTDIHENITTNSQIKDEAEAAGLMLAPFKDQTQMEQDAVAAEQAAQAQAAGPQMMPQEASDAAA